MSAVEHVGFHFNNQVDFSPNIGGSSAAEKLRIHTPKLVSVNQATQILDGFKVDKLVRHRLISPRYSDKEIKLGVTGNDVIKAFRIKMIKKQSPHCQWDEVRPFMSSLFTEQGLLEIQNDQDWIGAVTRAKEHKLDLQAEMNGLLHAARSRVDTAQHTSGTSSK